MHRTAPTDQGALRGHGSQETKEGDYGSPQEAKEGGKVSIPRQPSVASEQASNEASPAASAPQLTRFLHLLQSCQHKIKQPTPCNNRTVTKSSNQPLQYSYRHKSQQSTPAIIMPTQNPAINPCNNHANISLARFLHTRGQKCWHEYCRHSSL